MTIKNNLRHALLTLALCAVFAPSGAVARSSRLATDRTYAVYWNNQELVEYVLPDEWKVASPDNDNENNVVDVVDGETSLTLALSMKTTAAEAAAEAMAEHAGQECMKGVETDSDADDVRGICSLSEYGHQVRAKKLANGKVFVGWARSKKDAGSRLMPQFHEFMDGVRAPLKHEIGRRADVERERLRSLLRYDLPSGFESDTDGWMPRYVEYGRHELGKLAVMAMGPDTTPGTEVNKWRDYRSGSPIGTTTSHDSVKKVSYGFKDIEGVRHYVYAKQCGTFGTVLVQGSWPMSKDEEGKEAFMRVVDSLRAKDQVQKAFISFTTPDGWKSNGTVPCERGSLTQLWNDGYRLTVMQVKLEDRKSGLLKLVRGELPAGCQDIKEDWLDGGDLYMADAECDSTAIQGFYFEFEGEHYVTMIGSAIDQKFQFNNVMMSLRESFRHSSDGMPIAEGCGFENLSQDILDDMY